MPEALPYRDSGTYRDALPYNDVFLVFDIVEAIKGGHASVAVRLSILDSALQATGISAPIMRQAGGSVVVDPASLIRRVLTLPLAGLHVPDAAGAVWWGTPIRVEYGIFTADGSEWIPVFTGYVDEAEGEVGQDGPVGVITARDRMKRLDRVLGEPLTFAAGQPMAVQFRQLFEFCGMGTDDALYDLEDGGKTMSGEATYEANINATEVARAWCDDYALQAYASTLGVATLRPVPDPSAATAVISLRRGEEMRLLGFRKRWKDLVRNRAIVVGKGPLGPVRAEARDLNPLSLTYNPPDGTGPLGDRPDIYESDGITSEQQAREVAAARLPLLALISEEIEWLTAVDPMREGYDVIEIVEPDTDTEGNYLLGRFTVPFDVTAAQTGQTQRVVSLAAP
jgi:uncharacterized protein DUF5047